MTNYNFDSQCNKLKLERCNETLAHENEWHSFENFQMARQWPVMEKSGGGGGWI